MPPALLRQSFASTVFLLGAGAFFLLGASGLRRRVRRHTTAAAWAQEEQAPLPPSPPPRPPQETTRFIAGVPVFNYHLAYSAAAIEGHSARGFVAEAEWVADWLVMLKPGTTDAELADLCKASSNSPCKLVGSPSQGGVPFFEMRGTESALEVIIRSAQGAIKYVEADQILHLISPIEEENDMRGDGGRTATPPPVAATWGLNRIGATKRSRTGAGINIFVIDTGVRVTHEEFGGRAIPTLDYSFFDTDNRRVCHGQTNCATDRQGHGTHCAGTAAGATFGVAPAATVRSVKVVMEGGSARLSCICDSLDWVVARGTRPAVVSMSLTGSGNDQAMKDSIDIAVYAGITVVVAAGNDSDNACRYQPAFVPTAITVGSITSTNSKSSFSSYGSCVQIWAPGSLVLSAKHKSDIGTLTQSGTSMATPHVAGAAALVLEASPLKSAAAVLQALHRTAAIDTIFGLEAGDTNALLYVGADGAPPSAAPGTTPVPTPAPRCQPNSTFEERGSQDDVCRCDSGLYCYQDGKHGCRSRIAQDYKHPTKFLPTCANCMCTPKRPFLPPPDACPADTTSRMGVYGNCFCKGGHRCYDGDALTPGCPTTMGHGIDGLKYDYKCTKCHCEPYSCSCPSGDCSQQPDHEGDCVCGAGRRCYQGGVLGCNASITPTEGVNSDIAFLASCEDCDCRLMESGAISVVAQVWLLALVPLLLRLT